MFKLSKNIQEANADFKTFKKIFEKFKEYNINIPKDLLNNKRLFLKKVLTIENILNTHKDYKAILDNIFHNFTFFLKHFNLIEEWLLSNDFNEKYKKQNHPYPSLLDPKKLNDKNETINYHNIAAELAWEMNLPLPENYEFVFLAGGLSGHGAMMSFFNDCNIRCLQQDLQTETKRYYGLYNFLQVKGYNIIRYEQVLPCNYSKFFKLITKKVPIIFLVRDPIARLKTGANHPFRKNLVRIDLKKASHFNFFIRKYLVNIRNGHKIYADIPSLFPLNIYISSNYFLQATILNHFIANEIIFIDCAEIFPPKAKNTILNLSQKLKFSAPSDSLIYKYNANNYFMAVLPIILQIDKILVHITTSNYINLNKQFDLINICTLFFDQPLKYENLGIYIKPEDYDNLIYNHNSFLLLQKYLKEFMIILEQRIELEKSKLFKEEDILNYLKENKELRLKLKNILDKELIHIKQHRPDIVASWKYYQEFEKMCEELD
ncbi:DUF2972 domain-containing protein [Campylobacter bilis]